MLLIVSSTILELIQSFLPIPDMISSAALAIVVGIFIGWEERIVNSLIDDSASIQETVPTSRCPKSNMTLPRLACSTSSLEG